MGNSHVGQDSSVSCESGPYLTTVWKFPTVVRHTWRFSLTSTDNHRWGWGFRWVKIRQKIGS